MRILDIQTALPSFSLTQTESWQTLQAQRDLSRREMVLYKRFMTDPGIESRHFAIDQIADCFCDRQDELIRRFERQAGTLSAHAVGQCINAQGLTTLSVERLVTATCTGYICPGLSSHIIEQLGLRDDLFAVDLVGMGCGGALPLLRTLWNDTRLAEDSVSVGVCTEICSAAVAWEDDPGLMLSNAIFGDGSAAVALGKGGGRRGWRIVDFCFKTLPAWRDKLRFVTRQGKLCNVLAPEVPQMVAETLEHTLAELLTRTGHRKEDIPYWAIHAGGRKVIDAIVERLQLTEEHVHYTREVLRDCGNMSSPTVLFVLQRITSQADVQVGDKLLMAAFGAGFTMYTALLEYV